MGNALQYSYRLSDIEKTLFYPLYGRARAACLYPEVFPDRESGRLVRELGLGKNITDVTAYESVWYALRQQILCDYTSQYLKKHPSAIVINLGCGLDNLRAHIANDHAVFVNIDLAAVIKLRKKVLPDHPREFSLIEDMMNFRWMANVQRAISYVSNSKEVYIICSGVLHYFEPERVSALLCAITEHFVSGGICIDCESRDTIQRVNQMLLLDRRLEDLRLTFSMQDADEILVRTREQWKEIHVLDSLPEHYKTDGLPDFYYLNKTMQRGMLQFRELLF